MFYKYFRCFLFCFFVFFAVSYVSVLYLLWRINNYLLTYLLPQRKPGYIILAEVDLIDHSDFKSNVCARTIFTLSINLL